MGAAGPGGTSASVGEVGCAKLLLRFEGSGIFSSSPLGRKVELTLCSVEAVTELFPLPKAEFFLLRVSFCAGENMEDFSEENPPAGSVGGCSAPSAAVWKCL